MNRFLALSQVLAVVVFALVACAGEEVVVQTSDTSAPKAPPAPHTVITTYETVVTTDARGGLSLTLPVDAGTTSMVIELINLTDDTLLAVDAVYSASGELFVAESSMNYSEWSNVVMAMYPVGSALQLPLPVDDVDAPLEPGGWFVEANLYTASRSQVSRSGVQVAARLTMKQQPTAARPSLKVHVVYVDGVEDDEALITGVDAAVAMWRDTATTLHGFDLQVRTSTADLPLGDSANGNSSLRQMSVQSEPGEITMLLGQSVLGGGSLVGQAGGIPGPVVPSDDSGIVINVRTFGGVDGVLDDNEVKSLVGTLAHETGHYLGVHHPVQIDFETLDKLADTAACEGPVDCRRKLLTNVMCPTAVDGDVEQHFTPGQALIMQRSVFVR